MADRYGFKVGKKQHKTLDLILQELDFIYNINININIDIFLHETKILNLRGNRND